MKKLVTIVFTVFYLFIISGITFHIHYCHNQVSEISISASGHPCTCDVTNENTSCCTEKQERIQLDTEQLFSEILRINPILPQTGELQLEKLSDLQSSFESKCTTTYIELPPPKYEPLWLLNSEFSFYG